MNTKRDGGGKYAKAEGAKCVKRAVSLDPDVYEYIEEYRLSRKGKHFSTALNRLIRETRGPLKPIKKMKKKQETNGVTASAVIQGDNNKTTHKKR